ERGRSHVHAHLAVVFQARRDQAAQRLDAELALRGEAARVHELHEAARAVAALLDLAAVGVEDAVAEIRVGAGRPLHRQHLVAAHAKVAIRERPDLAPGEGKPLLRAVEDDEIVARALHLREPELHALARTMLQMRSTVAASRSGWIGSESTVCAACSEAGSERFPCCAS